MTEKEEYELPHHTIKKVQKGLEELRKKAEKKKTISSETFLTSLKGLTGSMNELANLFKEATKDIKEEEETAVELKEKIEPLLKKIDTVEDENKKIAQGILTIADMIKDLEAKLEKPTPPMFMRAPAARPVPPRMPRPGPMPPRPPGAAMPPPRPTIPTREMPTPHPPVPPGAMPPPPERPPAPRPEMPPPPGAPLPPLGPPPKPPGFPPMPPPPGIPPPTELPPPGAPPAPKKKGFFAKLLGRK